MDMPTKFDDVIDSRDIIARIEELEADDDRDEDDDEELRILQDLALEAAVSSDWEYGETLIRDSYFREYAEQLADDLGYTHRACSWPYTCIDWDSAARELQVDYFTVEFDGVQYWIRS